MGEASGISRRRLLAGGAVAIGAAAMAPPLAHARPAMGSAPNATSGTEVVDCFGEHHAGIELAPQALTTLAAFTLRPGLQREDLARLMKVWSSDIARLTQGLPTLADPVPELAELPASLTLTVGFGPGLFDVPGLSGQRPTWLAPLPAFKGDALQPGLSGGDLLIQACADDPIAAAHAITAMTTAAADFAQPAWTQSGFHRAAGMTEEATIGRNMMGFVDGIINPKLGSDDFDAVVWNTGTPPWLRGGTGMVLRRFQVDTNGWTALSTHERELAVGRTADTGAPLTGGDQSSPADLEAVDEYGLSVIPSFAHVRLAAPAVEGERVFRRSYNFDDGVSDGKLDRGSLFIAYGADIERQFTPIQQRLADSDLMHKWLTATGSAVFAIPPGFTDGGWLGQSLLSS